MTRQGCLDTIDTLLGSVSGMDPAFVAISRGESLNVPTYPWCAFWISGENVIEEMNTLGDESTITNVTIRSYHPAAMDPATNEAIVLDIWNAISGIRASLLGDANLSDNCSQIQVNNAVVEIGELNGKYHYQSTQIVDIWTLGATTVTP